MVESHMNLANDKTKAYIMASIYDIHAKKYEMMVNEKLIMDSLQAMFGQPSSSLIASTSDQSHHYQELIVPRRSGKRAIEIARSWPQAYGGRCSSGTWMHFLVALFEDPYALNFQSTDGISSPNNGPTTTLRRRSPKFWASNKNLVKATTTRIANLFFPYIEITTACLNMLHTGKCCFCVVQRSFKSDWVWVLSRPHNETRHHKSLSLPGSQSRAVCGGYRLEPYLE
uniref:Uncharacterized protein n=1 Tax=Cucumis melo TaxID=3656 RepID=A0A9I9EAT4_CUCME